MTGETFAFVQLALGRWVAYGGTVVVVGAAAFLVGVVPALRAAKEIKGAALDTIVGRVARFAVAGAALLLVANAWRLYAQTYSVFGLDEPVTMELVGIVAFDTGWGSGWLAQAGGAVLSLACLVAALRSPTAWRQPLTVVAAVAAAFVMTLTGHAVAEARAAILTVGFQTVHILAGGAWVGGLAFVLLTGLHLRRADDAATTPVVPVMVNAFSNMAVTAVAAVAGSGLLTAIMYLPSVSYLWQSAYGLTLLGKFGLFLGIGAVGAYNWKVLKPKLERGGASRTLLRSATLELAVADLLLAVTAVLVALPLET